jgi:hypothetical protein
MFKEEVEGGQFNVLLTTYEYIMKVKVRVRVRVWHVPLCRELKAIGWPSVILTLTLTLG